MTALAECTNAFAAVPRARGQQLKDQAQLDVWQRDGSAAYIESLAAGKEVAPVCDRREAQDARPRILLNPLRSLIGDL